MGIGQNEMAHHSGGYNKSPSVSARANITCVKFSHPFQNRSLFLEPKIPTKIGRSGIHISCDPNNAIFDCVVISRDHARIWFEDGRFYLQDTKSSNGTFVNNELIGEKAKDSPPMVVYSSDVVQFGSAVFSPDMKSRLGSIIGMLKLYLPDGSEVPPRPPSAVTTTPAIPTVQLYQLSACLQEAEHREQKLRKKLVILQHIMETSWSAAGGAWKSLIHEDLLLTKLDFLQRKMDSFSKTSQDDLLRQEMVKLNESQCVVQGVFKKQLETALVDRVEANQKREDLERCRDNLETECSHYKAVAKQTQDDLKDLGQKYTLYFEKYQSILQKVETDRNMHEKCKMLEQEKRQLKEYADKVIAEKEMLEKCMITFQNVNTDVGSSTSTDLLTKDVLESPVVSPGSAIKPKFSVTIVNENLELIEDVSGKLDLNDKGDSRIDSLFKRFECIERVENIRTEKVKNIRLQLENLKEQNKSIEGLNMTSNLKESMDSIENDLAFILPKDNRSSKIDKPTIDNTNYSKEVIFNLKDANTRLTLQLSELEESFRYLDAKKDLYQMDLKTLTLKGIEADHENEELRKKLTDAHTEINAKNNTIFELKKKTFLLEKSSEEDLQQVGGLQNKLQDQQVQNDQMKRNCDSGREELARLNDALNKSQVEHTKLELSKGQLTSETATLHDACASLRAECARNEAGKKTYQAAQDDFIVLNQKMFEQMRVIEQMESDMADAERQRGVLDDLLRELTEARQENADLGRTIDHLKENIDPTIGYFLPLIVALVFVFAVVLFSQPMHPSTADTKARDADPLT